MSENEIVFAITPHIVRSQDLNEQNVRPIDIGTGSVVEMRHPAPDVPANTSAKATPRGTVGAAAAPKAARATGVNPPAMAPATAAPAAAAPAATAAPNIAAPPPQMSATQTPRTTTETSKAEGPGDSCPKGATPDHPIGCYLNGGWQVDVGDGRGYQPPPGSGTTGARSGEPAKGVTGTSSHQDPKSTPPAGPIV